MSEARKDVVPRCEFLKKTAAVAAASALAGVSVPRVHAAEDNTIQLARSSAAATGGSGAVGDALSCGAGPVKLVAMADIFPNRLEGSHKALTQAVRRPDRRPGGAAISGLRRLSQGDRLPAARRRGPADHARRLPHGPL